MKQLALPVRNNSLIGPITYTMKDQNGNIINLTPYSSAFMEIKQQGFLVATISATILSPPTMGQVQVASHTFSGIGIWQIQFYVMDNSGNKVYGEPLQFNCVPNEDDLTLNQLAQF